MIVVVAATFSLALGLSTTLFGIRGILGPWVGTLLYSSGALPLQDIFFLIAGITTAGGVLLLVFSREQRARRRAARPAVPPYSSSSSTSR